MSRAQLARLPTPLVRLDRASAVLGLELWVKRDDLTGFGLSGNKVRKLERLLGEAVARGCDTVLTTGGLQSNHCRATAVACRELGLAPVLLLRGEPQAVPDGNLLIDQLVGAELHFCTPADYRTRRDAILDELAAGVRARGGRPYVIPEGGSNGLGACAFADASAEVGRQGGRFDHVFCAVGSGGTVAGLALGPDIGRIVGVPVCDDAAWFRAIVHRIAGEAAGLGVGPLPEEGARWGFLEGYQGPAYGVAEPPVWDTIRWLARLEGLLLDPTYTGKAAHALVEEARAGRISGRVLLWHTGGAFGLFGRGAEAVAAG
jgi:D-cysteine desulfhydrase